MYNRRVFCQDLEDNSGRGVGDDDRVTDADDVRKTCSRQLCRPDPEDDDGQDGQDVEEIDVKGYEGKN